jgi:hypothetical protein
VWLTAVIVLPTQEPEIPRVLTAYLKLADRCRASREMPLTVTVVAHKADLRPDDSCPEDRAVWDGRVRAASVWIRQQNTERFRFTSLSPLETSMVAQTPVQMRDQLLDAMTFSINSLNWGAVDADAVTLATEVDGIDPHNNKCGA